MIPPAAPDYAAYDWRGQAERVAVMGDGRAVLLIAPFFEEANRTRKLLVDVMRGLAARGLRAVLPDLPGTLESPTPLASLEWREWGEAVALVARRFDAAHLASTRAGALLDGVQGAASRWRLAPIDGAQQMRELVRIKLAAEREAGRATTAASLETELLSAPSEIAGHRLRPEFLAALMTARLDETEHARTVRLSTDAQPADAKFEGQPLWRRAEPGEDVALSQLLADDIADHLASCVAG